MNSTAIDVIVEISKISRYRDFWLRILLLAQDSEIRMMKEYARSAVPTTAHTA